MFAQRLPFLPQHGTGRPVERPELLGGLNHGHVRESCGGEEGRRALRGRKAMEPHAAMSHWELKLRSCTCVCSRSWLHLALPNLKSSICNSIGGVRERILDL
jgi:hypothetical protein